MKHLTLGLLILMSVSLHAEKVALCIMATGKYLSYAENVIASARKHFCKEHEVFYFLFTDGIVRDQASDIVRIEQKRLGWPYDTMMRFHAYHSARHLLEKMDYIFATDADMLFVDTVGSEILSELVATRHPGFLNQRGSYETNKKSKAYVRRREGKHYFAGGFYGGKSSSILSLLRTVIANVDDDLKRGIVAVWHDESHLNRYFIDNKPTLILSPSYCYPENWQLPFHKRLLALDKNHAEMRK